MDRRKRKQLQTSKVNPSASTVRSGVDRVRFSTASAQGSKPFRTAFPCVFLFLTLNSYKDCEFSLHRITIYTCKILQVFVCHARLCHKPRIPETTASMSTGWQTQCNMVMLQRCWGQHYVHTIWLYPVKTAQQVKETHIASYCIYCKAWFQTFRSNVQVCTAISQNTSPMHSNASKKQMDLVGILRSLHDDPSTLLEYTNLARMAPTIHSIYSLHQTTTTLLHSAATLKQHPLWIPSAHAHAAPNLGCTREAASSASGASSNSSPSTSVNTLGCCFL